jgi:hypothetical protein
VDSPVGDEQFTYCVQCCGGELAKWRAAHGISSDLKFVFDLSPNRHRDEIARVFFGAASGRPQFKDGIEQWFKPTGVSFESRKDVIQLLSADMLAWEAAKIRALDVFGRGRLEEAVQLAYLFTKTNHIKIGCIPSHVLKNWEMKMLRCG